MPTLETYKKQAKQILHWHRDREWTVAAIIRAHVPRFNDLHDRAILDSDFRLADAQELVARRAGYQDWAALKAVAPADGRVRRADGEATAVLRYAIPHIFVTDMERAVAFYREILGLRVDLLYGEPPFFGIVGRDLARFCLRLVDAGVVDADAREHEQLLSVGIGVEDAAQLKALFEEFRAAGASFYQPIKRHPWGGRNFIVRDPDGNLLSFECGPDGDE